MDASPELLRLAGDLRERYPRFRLAAKERSRAMRVLAVLVRPFNPAFLDGYTTTIGFTVYMPRATRLDPVGGPLVLRHEAVHLAQFRAHPVWFPLSYLLVAPAFVTMRARWEMEAYVESMRAELELTGTIGPVDGLVKVFTGPDYLFMDVRARTVRRRLERAREELLCRSST